MTRAKALLRRTQLVSQQNIISKIGDFALDFSARRIEVAGKELELTPKEFDLLQYLITNKGQVISRERILDKVWGYNYFGDLRTVDTHVKNLREKLGTSHALYLKTVWGIGYKFEVSK